MNSESLDIAISRIRQIESRVAGISQRINHLQANSDLKINSFDNILDKKINSLEKLETTQQNKQNNNSSIQEKTGEENVEQLVEKYSLKNGLNKNLVNAVIQTESNFNNKAVSTAGAQGLMQLMPATAKDLGVDDSFDPEQNISGGTKYLKSLINKYDSVELGLAAYNAGPTAVNKFGGVPPYDETQNYVQKIMKLQKNQ